MRAAHGEARGRFGLPPEPPRDPDGVACRLCTNACRIAEGGIGYCGVRRNEGGRILGGEGWAALDWYHDPLPTNCVGIPWCAGGTECGHPEFSVAPGTEHGHKNLAVFYHGCTFDCLFCQNWHFKASGHRSRGARVTPAALAQAADARTTCICYFGGDPTPFVRHALAASELARQDGGRIMRICWETNGSMAPDLAERMMALSLESGGCVKFDLKAWSSGIHEALCGAGNERTLSNFRELARRIADRPDPPPLIASTLLVPGYVEADEVAQLSRFVAECDGDIPYALLAFCPQFCMEDLPTTSRRQAAACLEGAHDAGLTRVRLGNAHLIGSGQWLGIGGVA
jgi:pyruvate formate lyase activating enzyme